MLTITLTELDDYNLVHRPGEDGVDLYLRHPDQDKDSALNTICVRANKLPLWERVKFVDGLDDPELDIEFIDANLLHWGTGDFDVIQIRLPEPWRKEFLIDQSFTPVNGC